MPKLKVVHLRTNVEAIFGILDMDQDTIIEEKRLTATLGSVGEAEYTKLRETLVAAKRELQGKIDEQLAAAVGPKHE